MFAQPSTELAVIETDYPPLLLGEGQGVRVPTLAAIWHVDPGQSERAMLALWYRLRDEWLTMQESEATKRSYATGTIHWMAWLAEQDIQPWSVTSSHVRAWQSWLEATGKTPSTVNQRLSAVSSYYQFVINEVHLVDGIERSAFFDASGATRANPFKVGNLKRPKVTQYGKAQPLHPHTIQQLFAHLRSHAETLTGSRNYALILTHLLTASRGSEIVRLTWGDIRPNRNQSGSFVFAWTGKGDKSETSPLPADAYHAIVAHLKIAGRWLPGHPDHIKDNEYIFQPLVTHGIGNLRNAKKQGSEATEPHLSPKSAQRILQTALRAAGVPEWADYRIHDLRHTFAHAHHAQFSNLEELRKLLHHNSIATTGIYIRNMDDPVDKHSQAILSQLGLL